MDKIVMLASDRPRPRRSPGLPHSGARILFFTGVRYCRDEEPSRPVAVDHHLATGHAPPMELALDLAAH